MVNLEKITTETRNEKTLDIDEKSTIEMLRLINDEDKKVPNSVGEILDDIACVVDYAYETLCNNGRVIYAGAGTSGRIGIIDAVECRPTFSVDDNTFVALMAGGERAFIKAVEGAEDNFKLAEDDLKNINFNEKDFFIGLTASGRTPYVIGGVNYSKQIGAKTACVTTSKNSILKDMVDFPIECFTGSEVITGSTRMKSGTAQKLILNMISTATMIKMGKVYGNLMIDVQATNQKLVARQNRIIREITGKTEVVVSEAMKKYNNGKLTTFSLLTGEENKAILEKYLNDAKGNLKLAIKNYLK